MLDVAVPEVRLQCPRIVSLVGQSVAASVPEHVRMDLKGKLGLPTRSLDHAGEPCSAEGCSALRVSSRSASLSARAALRRGNGAIPPLSANTR
jgi:hypothetical protein